MKIYLLFFSLFITPQLLFPESTDNDTDFSIPSSLPECADLTGTLKKNPGVIIDNRPIKKEELIAYRDKALLSSSKSDDKLNKEIVRSKKMACQTGIGIGFVFFIKTIGDAAKSNATQHVFIAAGSIFCLISAWETLKAGCNAARYVVKREYQKYYALHLIDSIENFNDNQKTAEEKQ